MTFRREFTIGASAAGTSTEEAYRDGASYGKGLAYGAASGATEMLTEKLLPGPADTVIGKSIFGGAKKEIADQGVKRIVKEVARNAVNEGAEEVFSELTNPGRKAIYKGVEAFEEYKEPEFYKGVLEAGKTGALTSAVFGSTIGNVTKGKGYNGDIQASIESIEELSEKRDAGFARGDNSERKQINNKIDENLQLIEKKLKDSTDENRKEYIERYRLSKAFNDDGSLKEIRASEQKYDERYYSPEMDGSEDLLKEDIDTLNQKDGTDFSVYEGELNEKGAKAFEKIKKMVNALNKRGGEKLSLIVVDDTAKFKGVIVGGNRLYIRANVLEGDSWSETPIHEYAHYGEETMPYSTLTELLEGDKSLKLRAQNKVFDSSSYGITAENMLDIAERYHNGEDVTEEEAELYDEFSSEVGANMIAETLGNEAFIDKIVALDGNAAQKLVCGLKELKRAVSSLKSKESREQYNRIRHAEKLFLKAAEAVGNEDLARYILSDMDDEEDEIDKSEKIAYNRDTDNKRKKKPKGRTARYPLNYKVGNQALDYVHNQLRTIYQGISEGIADGIAIAQDEYVYIVDSGKENGLINFGIRKKFKFSDDQYRENYIRSTNDDAISKGHVSDELSEKLRGGYDNHRRSDMRRESGAELSADTGETEYKQSGISGDNADRGRVSSSIAEERDSESSDSGSDKTKVRYSREETSGEASEERDYSEYDKPITIKDVEALRSIKRKSVNGFTFDDIKKAQKWAYKLYKDLGVKSPFFRAWFGEWRGEQREKKISIADIPEYIASNDGRKKNRGTVVNDDTNWDIRISREGETNTISHSGEGRLSEYGLAGIQELVRKAILFDTEVHEHHSNNAKEDRIAFDHRLYSLGRDSDGNVGLYRITVEETYQDPKHPNDMRFHNLKYIEKVADTIGSLTHNQDYGAESTSDVSTTIYSISDLFDFVNRFDKDFNHNTVENVNEHFVDKKTGEPKVFYLEKRAGYNWENGVRVYEKQTDVDNDGVTPVYISSYAEEGTVPNYEIQEDGSVLVFDAGQIKAVGNTGTFDRRTKKVRYSREAGSENAGSGINLPLLNRSQFKIYTKENAEQIISSITLNTLNFNDGTQGTIKNKGELVDMMWRRLNSAEAHKRGGVALELAEEVLQRVAVKAIYDDPNNAQYIEELNTIKEYLHKFNLDDIKGEIEHKFGKKQAQGIMLVWGAKKGEMGLSPDTVAQELTSREISIDAENDADCFFETRGGSDHITEKAENRWFRSVVSDPVFCSFCFVDFSLLRYWGLVT